MVSLVVVNYNDAENTIKFLKTISAYNAIEHIVVVDNASTDDSYERLKKYASFKIEIIKNKNNGGYGAGNNLGIDYLWNKYNTEICIISNSDVEFSQETVSVLEERIRQNDILGVVAAVMKKPDGNIRTDTAWNIPTGWQYTFSTCCFPLRKLSKSYLYQYEQLTGQDFYADAVAGSMLMIRVKDFKDAGGYDENIFLYGEENVLGIKMKSISKKTLLVTDCYFIHNHSTSINKSIPSKLHQKELIYKSRTYVLEKYYGFNSLEMLIVKSLFSLSSLLESLCLSFRNFTRKGVDSMHITSNNFDRQTDRQSKKVVFMPEPSSFFNVSDVSNSDNRNEVVVA